jgi:hypothetical protein
MPPLPQLSFGLLGLFVPGCLCCLGGCFGGGGLPWPTTPSIGQPLVPFMAVVLLLMHIKRLEERLTASTEGAPEDTMSILLLGILLLRHCVVLLLIPLFVFKV